MQINVEQQNKQRGNSYPFADNMQLTTLRGQQLPPDYLVDALLTPTRTAVLYLMSVEYGRVRVGDYTTRQPVASGTFDGDVCILHDLSGFERPAGVLVAGDGFTRSTTPDVFELMASDALFTSAAVVPMRVPGVQGLLVGDTLLTGHIQVEEGPGIRLDADPGSSRLTINAVGQQTPGAAGTGVVECFELPPAVRAVRVVVEAGAYITAAVDGNRLILYPLFPQQAVCPPDVRGIVAGITGNTDVEVCAAPEATGSRQEFVVFPVGGTIRIESAAGVDGSMPLRVVSGSTPGDAGVLGQALDASRTRRQAETAVKRSLSGIGSTGSVTLTVRGRT